jgi:hypothetical protein
MAGIEDPARLDQQQFDLVFGIRFVDGRQEQRFSASGAVKPRGRL